MTQINLPLKPSDYAYEKFKQEAELFFVKKYLDGNAVKEKYTFCLDAFFKLDNNKEMDYGRGIIMASPNYGQGKSFFFDVIEHRCKRVEKRNIFKRTTAKDLVLYCIENGEDALKDFIKVRNLYIDDIGDEGENKTFQIKKSKNMVNVLRFVLLYRYEMWIKKGWKTYGTTNLTIAQMGECYDGRLADRLKQMVHWVDVKFLADNKSFRQMAGTRPLTQEEIAENWKKLSPVKKEIQKPDVIKYLNELINDDDEYIKNMGWIDWKYIKKQLLSLGFLKESDFVMIDEEALQFAELVLRKDTVDYVKFTLRYADREVRLAERNRKLSEMGPEDVREMAETILAKQVFLSLREKKHTFTDVQ